jgi:hypothetical protein
VPDDHLSPDSLWQRRVDRVLGPPAWRNYDARARDAAHQASDATHDFLHAVGGLDDPTGGSEAQAHRDSEAWFAGAPATEVQAKALREYLARLGEISGAGPYPE